MQGELFERICALIANVLRTCNLVKKWLTFLVNEKKLSEILLGNDFLDDVEVLEVDEAGLLQFQSESSSSEEEEDSEDDIFRIMNHQLEIILKQGYDASRSPCSTIEGTGYQCPAEDVDGGSIDCRDDTKCEPALQCSLLVHERGCAPPPDEPTSPTPGSAQPQPKFHLRVVRRPPQSHEIYFR